jgi:hypothetical protein
VRGIRHAPQLSDVKVRGPTTEHAVSMQQVHRGLDGEATSRNESVTKAKITDLLTRL